MKIYKISQSSNQDYDTFDSAVVCANDEESARNMNPRNGESADWSHQYSWCDSPDKVTVEYIGEAVDSLLAGVVVASFNAG